MGTNKSHFHNAIIIIYKSDQPVNIMYNFKPRTVILYHFCFWKISQHILPFLPNSSLHYGFPRGNAFTCRGVFFSQHISFFEVNNKHLYSFCQSIKKICSFRFLFTTQMYKKLAICQLLHATLFISRKWLLCYKVFDIHAAKVGGKMRRRNRLFYLGVYT
jgi:hypothetical protein